MPEQEGLSSLGKKDLDKTRAVGMGRMRVRNSKEM